MVRQTLHVLYDCVSSCSRANKYEIFRTWPACPREKNLCNKLSLFVESVNIESPNLSVIKWWSQHFPCFFPGYIGCIGTCSCVRSFGHSIYIAAITMSSHAITTCGLASNEANGNVYNQKYSWGLKSDRRYVGFKTKTCIVHSNVVYYTVT